MRVHRFLTGPETELKQDFWLHDDRLLHQWRKVLRFAPGQQVVLFDGKETERLYKIVELDDQEAHLHLVTDLVRKLPDREVYLLWALLKNDKNDWIVQKCTELGVSHFLPLIADRSTTPNLNLERAQKIMVEAAEQCGRSDVPDVREPMRLQTAIDQLKGKIQLFAAEQLDAEKTAAEPELSQKVGLFIGPEGGWSDAEKAMFADAGIPHMSMGHLVYRAETAAVVAAGHVLSKPMV